MINQNILERKGARKVEEVPEEVLELLNTAKIPTVNLTEWLAVDHVMIIENAFPDLGLNETISGVITIIQNLKKPTSMSITREVGTYLGSYSLIRDISLATYQSMSSHPSDSVRCYAPYIIGLNEQMSLNEKLEIASVSAADEHFGVREIAWMALRPSLDAELPLAIELLSKWTKDPDPNVRRFASEATRPRGVWCKHIDQLKEHPEKALPILNPLKSDTTKYVQDSVGNWLNDASKTRPDFVISVCERWSQESPTKETAKIIKKAMRSLEK
ncbi:MAG: DNA alkylation repair protein [Flammeovirgaceae bacterium]|nr:DNA alkylation repair protein [Flammeovirgaceae bacterium]MBE61702.1 DNA alkylation repair protein [Flammeovirgaceae bacterium]HCX20969.1 DNA alkylation repair protein [Cytophagales bacterium]